MSDWSAPLAGPAYAREVPPLDAPPHPAFCRCACGALLLARVWHNRTAAEAAHWELPRPPVTAALGRPHACQQVRAA